MSQTTPPVPRRMSIAAKGLVILSFLNLATLCAISYLIYSVSETWWVSTVLTYAPRLPYLIPTVMLMLASLFWCWRAVGINLVALVVVLVPIMGLSLPLELWFNGSPKNENGTLLKLVSCNVQLFKPHFEQVLDEISTIDPDVVALQEASRDDPRLKASFPDWHVVHEGQYWVGSRYPVKIAERIDVDQFGGRLAGIIVEIETPAGLILMANIHQMTARFGLMKLSGNSLFNGDGTKELEEFEEQRYLETTAVRAIVEDAGEDRPLIACGDFNTPTSSCLFQKQWGGMQSCFDVAAFGYGYTSPCKGGRFWPDNMPWARIDHILCSNEWAVRQCQIGRTDGSDHRLIAATVVLKQNKR